MRNPLRKQQLIKLGLMITAEDDQCYAGILKHKGLDIQFDIIYNLNGLLSIEIDKQPLLSKPVFTERQWMNAINLAHDNYTIIQFEKPLIMQVELQYMLEFSGGKMFTKYNLDPMTSLMAFSIVSESLRSVVEKNSSKPKQERMNGTQRQQHAFAIQLCDEIRNKLGLVVKEQAERKQKVNLETVSEGQAQDFLNKMNKNTPPDLRKV